MREDERIILGNMFMEIVQMFIRKGLTKKQIIEWIEQEVEQQKI